MKIAVDAMGGDHAPGVVVEGSVIAAREFGAEIILVGREDDIRRELARHNINGLSMTIVHASEVIEMHDHTMAVKEKKNNSLSVGMQLLKERKADAFVSAGNSGAVMAAALFGLGRIRGIDRPALASRYPASVKPTILLDLGVNTDPKPVNLVQNAVMGSLYARLALGIPNPRVAIVSNGEEPDKGSLLVRDTYKLLRDSPLNFIGNVEGKDIPQGAADVIVTDGFTGNVVLKLTEGIVSFLGTFLKESLTRGWLNKIGLILMVPGLVLMLPGLLFLWPAIRRLRRHVDYRELGAAPLLGVDGVVLIAHGRSDALAIRGAIRSAIRVAEGGIVEAIKAGLAEQVAHAAAPANQSPIDRVKSH